MLLLKHGFSSTNYRLWRVLVRLAFDGSFSLCTKARSLICCYISSTFSSFCSWSSWWFEQIEQGEENEINTYLLASLTKRKVHPLTCVYSTHMRLSLDYTYTSECQISLSSSCEKETCQLYLMMGSLSNTIYWSFFSSASVFFLSWLAVCSSAKPVGLGKLPDAILRRLKPH